MWTEAGFRPAARFARKHQLSARSSTALSGLEMNSRTLAASIPFVLALIAFAGALFVDHPIVFAICFTILIFDIPVCLFVGWDWLRTGEPPEINLSPMIPSRAERELIRNLRTRPKLADDEFYSTFYAESGVSKTSIASIRAILSEQIGMDLSALLPHDDLILIDPEMDWSIIIDEIEREFDVRFTDSELEGGPATFDFFVQHLLNQKPTREIAR
jgi:hypothetical protein